MPRTLRPDLPLRDGVSHFFVASNGEKRAVALDLKDPADRAYLAGLLQDADVLVENMKPGALARLGDVALVAREPIAYEDPADTGPFHLLGRHGSMTSAEVMVPLLVARTD